jgi:hypothetical protein
VERDLSESVLDALRDGLLLRGARIDVDMTIDGEPDRWPVAILVLRKAVVVAKEQKAAKEAEQALREGIEGLEAWAEAVSSKQDSGRTRHTQPSRERRTWSSIAPAIPGSCGDARRYWLAVSRPPSTFA